ncbi:LysR family transcriptional regulator [Nocardia sp. 2]|uniref:LysR family transcriptional regulator n=1 Tax=Nocardia acididurans TaxID=2802282 RepID=A0ABS1M5H3_9NOCA|nr:LysR family transcriptional regulator [Nocardia acididurans]MBL1075821.1 LysR family transcriptional regulator [Nocardia acididurans]
MLERLELEAFLTLAEELHFGRTAARLNVSTARVSQVIRKLERRIDAPLFERNNRTVGLTPLGKKLRDELRPAYDHIMASVLAARQAGGADSTITVGFSTPWCGNLVARAAELFRSRFPNITVEIEEIPLTDPLGRMRSGSVDLQLSEFPIAEPDITTGPIIYSEPRGLLMSRLHPFAERDTVSVEDLAGTTLITIADELVPRYWMDHHFPQRTPTGRPIPHGPTTNFCAEVLVHTRQGTAVSAIALQAGALLDWPQTVVIPLHDAPPIDYGLLWPTAGRNPLVKPFAETITEAAKCDDAGQRRASLRNA